VIRAVGLTLPTFIKWDDIEYGLRAAARNHPTVTLPGAAIWHMPWYAKDTATDWLIYFQARNRLITALLHSPGRPDPVLLRESLFLGLKYALTLQFSAVELLLSAIDDVCRGPARLHDELPTKMAQLAELVAGFPDAQAKGRFGKRYPQLIIPVTSDPWWLAEELDAELVTIEDGVSERMGASEVKRFAAMVRRLRQSHNALSSGWTDLADQYRIALPELVSPGRWRSTFAGTGSAPEPSSQAAGPA
jgi:galactofuranosylgalactofuranosylrhamnosyl-N-acetylglucosaminyl-diphospho-decaprenol beta-1,5/1,6-galactofuranosyltransferase